MKYVSEFFIYILWNFVFLKINVHRGTAIPIDDL